MSKPHSMTISTAVSACLEEELTLDHLPGFHHAGWPASRRRRLQPCDADHGI
jgi:hypothetical protein